MMKARLVAFSLCLATFATADTVRLKDGTTLQGDVKRGDDGWVVYTADGKARYVAPDQVQSIDLAAGASTQTSSADQGQFDSLRRSVDLSSDPAQAVNRYRSFVDRNPNPALDAQARKELAVWQDRLDKRMVKVGGQWVTSQEADRLRGQTILMADTARRLLRDGKTAQAEQVVNQVLDLDPRSPSGLYLRGLLLYAHNQVGPARQAFAVVNSIVPNHAPTLNNLAALFARQNQTGPAMYNYDQALLADPVNRQIVDNVAEFLHTLSPQDRDLPGGQRLVRRFTEQDAQLQDRLRADGLTRWGARWITQAEMAHIREQEKKVQERLNTLTAQFDEAKGQLAALESRISENDRRLHDIEANSVAYDPLTGRLLYIGYPLIYYDLDRENSQYKAQRQQLLVKLDQLRDAAKLAQDQQPVKPYTGVQRLIGEEGTPVAVDNVTTQPVAR
jgi:Tfp pilus assembly protein PilF